MLLKKFLFCRFKIFWVLLAALVTWVAQFIFSFRATPRYFMSQTGSSAFLSKSNIGILYCFVYKPYILHNKIKYFSCLIIDCIGSLDITFFLIFFNYSISLFLTSSMVFPPPFIISVRDRGGQKGAIIPWIRVNFGGNSGKTRKEKFHPKT